MTPERLEEYQEGLRRGTHFSQSEMREVLYHIAALERQLAEAQEQFRIRIAVAQEQFRITKDALDWALNRALNREADQRARLADFSSASISAIRAPTRSVQPAPDVAKEE